jgi:hypothetical protein
MRTFVILNVNDDVDICENIIKKLPNNSNILVYARESLKNTDFVNTFNSFTGNSNIRLRFYDDDIRFKQSNLRNFVSKQLLDEKITGFVHIIEDIVQIYNDSENFLDKIEQMMQVLNLKSWFNTSCDQCNFVYSKYNPRLYIAIDDERMKKVYDKTIAWCSNANTLWTIWNYDMCTFEDLRFEEKFQFSMYLIIEFLARRRNTKKNGELYYMNYYPSIPEELNVFKCMDVKNGKQFTNDEINNEGKIFKEMGIDNHADTDINVLMEDISNVLISKL